MYCAAQLKLQFSWSHRHSAETGKHFNPSCLVVLESWIPMVHIPKVSSTCPFKQISRCRFPPMSTTYMSHFKTFSLNNVLYRYKLNPKEMFIWKFVPNHHNLLILKLSMILSWQVSILTLIFRSYLRTHTTLCIKVFSSQLMMDTFPLPFLVHV